MPNGQEVIWRLIGHYDSVTTAYTACAGAKQTSPWRPDFNGRLIKIRTQNVSGAATSLTNGVQFKITSTAFTPSNEIHVSAQGAGLMTAPAVSTGPIMDFGVDVPIKTGVDVNVEGRNECGAETVVTPEVFVLGQFIVSGV